jgi:hypothetical protein
MDAPFGRTPACELTFITQPALPRVAASRSADCASVTKRNGAMTFTSDSSCRTSGVAAARSAWGITRLMPVLFIRTSSQPIRQSPPEWALLCPRHLPYPLAHKRPIQVPELTYDLSRPNCANAGRPRIHPSRVVARFDLRGWCQRTNVRPSKRSRTAKQLKSEDKSMAVRLVSAEHRRLASEASGHVIDAVLK